MNASTVARGHASSCPVGLAALDGASIADMAARLALFEGTARNHLSAAIQKLGTHNRLEAARLTEQQGWL